jgi:hypothetical protein
MTTPLRRTLLLALPLLLAACDDGTPLQELNRGLPSIVALHTDTSAFDQAAPGAVLPVEVRVTDPYGDVVVGTAVAWSTISSGARVAPDTTQTDGDGHATSSWTLGSSPGTYELRVNVPASGAGITITAQVR